MNHAFKHLYNSSRWKRRRRAHLQRFPLCAYCQAQGYTTAGAIVDHKIPHKGDVELFFNEENWQTLCKLHHDASKQKEEKRGKPIAIGIDGWPIT